MSKPIGEIIRDLRKANNITQEQLADILGVSFQSISRWENSLSYPDITLIPIIARYFDVSTDMLFDMNTHEREQTKERYEDTYKTHRQNGEIEQCRSNMYKEQPTAFCGRLFFIHVTAESNYSGVLG